MLKEFSIVMLCMFSTICNAHDVGVVANQALGIHKNVTYITSIHHATLWNNLDVPMVYQVFFQLCIDENNWCKEKSFDVPVPARSHVTLDDTLMQDHIFYYPGHHNSRATTAIKGDGAKSQVAYGEITIN